MFATIVLIIILICYYTSAYERVCFDEIIEEFSQELVNDGWPDGLVNCFKQIIEYDEPKLIHDEIIVWTAGKLFDKCVLNKGQNVMAIGLKWDAFWEYNKDLVVIPRESSQRLADGMLSKFGRWLAIDDYLATVYADNWTEGLQRSAEVIKCMGGRANEMLAVGMSETLGERKASAVGMSETLSERKASAVGGRLDRFGIPANDLVIIQQFRQAHR